MRVLIVEDEEGLAAGLKRGFEGEGFGVDLAATGTDGLWLARENPYDVIVLDIMLPGINGFKLCSTLRDEGNSTPILMLTAKDGELDEAEALDSGADDYLTKPFSSIILMARVRALLRRGPCDRSPLLHAGDLSLDPRAHRCRRKDTEIGLTAREFSILEYLMRNANDVVSKRDVIEHVWDFDFQGDPNIVEVYVRRLRDKVDRPFGRNQLQTVRGAGYRLATDE